MRHKDALDITAEIDLRVTYHDTDKMGHAYYSRYLVWFEIGRTELIRERVKSYRAMEDDGVFLPVRECHVRYRAPSFYDDLLTLHTAIDSLTATSVKFSYRLERKEGGPANNVEDGALIATGQTHHPFVSPERKILRVGLELFGIATSP